MATRRRAKNEENEAIWEQSNWDKKGKGMVSEEVAEETTLVPDDSEDDIEMYDSDEEKGEQAWEKRRRIAEHGTKDNQETREDEEWQGREGRGV